MKRNSSQHSGLTHRSDYISAPNDVDTLKSSHTQSSNVSVSSITGKKPADPEISGTKTHRHETTKKNYEACYLKLAHLIQEAYLEIKYQTIENNPACSSLLKKSIPLEEDDETTLQTDPVVLFKYIKQIYDKNFELKNSAEKDLNDQKENGVNDYEAMLQKLEAEVRQHIRIEQQLKLYVESTQAKLDDFEKNGDLPQVEDLKKVIEELRTENSALNEKLKRRTTEIETFFKDLNHKNGIIKKLEQQLESVPALKNKIREMESMLNSEAFKSGASTLRSYNRGSKEGEAFVKAVNLSNNGIIPDGKSRKNSQPSLAASTQDLLRKRGSEKEKEKGKDKENYDVLKMEMAKYNGDMNKLQFDSFRLNSDNNRTTDKISGGHSKYDVVNPKTSRQTEKSDEYKPNKTKKPGRSESSSNLHREKSKNTEYDAYPDERMSNLKMMANNDMIEQSRFGSERLLMDESQRRTLEKKRESSKTRNEYRETPDVLSSSRHSHKIPKSSRPSTGHYERQSYCPPEYYKPKKEPEVYDLSKLRSSPQKASTDRSQSVDAKTRLYREMKSRQSEHYDNSKTAVEDKSARRRSAYNIQPKHQQHNALNVSQKVSGVF